VQGAHHSIVVEILKIHRQIIPAADNLEFDHSR
jgi:hypothetical protein